MAGPYPYSPIQYQEEQNLIFPGEVKRGNRSIWDITPRTPQFFASSTNKGIPAFFQGAAVARHASGTGFILADNSAVATSAIGLACLGAPGQPEIVQLAGLFSMDDWTPITGVASLVPLAFYYLGVNGTLTTVLPVFPKIAQLVGYSISPKTLVLQFSQPVVGGGGAAGPPIYKVTTTAVNYVINGTDTVILASGNTLLTLPAAVGSGQSFWIKNIGVGVITINGGGGNIDGAPTATLLTQYEAIQVIDGGVNNWYVF